jgi:hypothetical protein
LFAVLAIPVTSKADSAADHLGLCLSANSAANCKIDQEKFKKEYPLAYKGDYQAQRNAAYCLFTGCDGAIRQNQILGCAWRIVIIASGSPKVDGSDTANLKYNCGQLSEVEFIAAKSQASRIIAKIK